MTARPDRARQPDRTSLAWQRTSMSAAVAAVLSVRAGLTGGGVAQTLAGVCLAALVVLASRMALVAARAPSGCARHTLLAATALGASAGLLTIAGLVGGR